MTEIYLFVAIGLIAALYSSVGHGGASGYLAVMTILGFSLTEMRSYALIMNLVVSGTAFLSFYMATKTDLRKLLPFLAGSVPAAFAGALTGIDTPVYRILLCCVLVIAALRILLPASDDRRGTRKIPFFPALLAGAGIGFLSGVIGIGGGILLSPLLIIFRWAYVRETACLSAGFIFINSAAGLTGVAMNGLQTDPMLITCVLVAFTGGVLGSLSGSRFLPVAVIRYALVTVLLLAGFKLLFI